MAEFDVKVVCVLIVSQFLYGTSADELLCEEDKDVKLPHETECHLYYDCSSTRAPEFATSERYLRECKYPQLFSTKTLRCEDFENVQCGTRIERKQACEYRANLCNGPNCSPCIFLYPSCAGLTDGVYPHPTKLGSPWKMECYKERLMRTFLQNSPRG
ncbi:uncharacterized protein LOC133194562 [Saccostrea echinata]|uniref:uncharacterized protein LOC133194562 n=1 Tax=Saccostrea echinata TaxID=191078 RepID=UPI002A7F0B55|nr:uncharacterized protein LOC133194562 [Saccostrea echinata]